MKRKCEVKVVDDNVVVVESNESSDSFKSAFKKLQGINKSISEGEQSKSQTVAAIDGKMLEKQLEGVNENLEYMNELRDGLVKVLKPFISEQVGLIRTKVGFLKKKNGFDRMGAGDKRVVCEAGIMADVAVEFGFDVNHEIMREVRSAEFKKVKK